LLSTFNGNKFFLTVHGWKVKHTSQNGNEKKNHICESKHKLLRENSLSQNLGLVYIVYHKNLIILHYIICRGWLKSHYLHCFET
jgi:hypothetical protein